MEIDISQYQICPDIHGDSPEDTFLLKLMIDEAKKYIGSQKWKQPIEIMYFAFGIGGIAAVFLVKFSKKVAESDDFLWVVVGDIPPAYLVIDSLNNPKDVIREYCYMIHSWATAIAKGKCIEDVFPFQTENTLENSHLIESKIEFLEKTLLKLRGIPGTRIPGTLRNCCSHPPSWHGVTEVVPQRRRMTDDYLRWLGRI